ncbi:MAG: PspC domain-containing protein [Bacteroidetes bacterium]|nr:PspC domain-containing protein [Bacteroidota bacterium]
MKKNFNVNIAGVIFHMDEDAYEKLSSYLDTLKRHFTHMEGREEILSDIESRIAEMIQLRLTDEKQVVVIEDVEHVISVMGQPSDWGDDASQPSGRHHDRPKRIYRDGDNKIIGGVCSGLGAYFHVDPLWIRLTFVAVTLLGFGAGIIAYILLWVLVPEARTTAEKLEMRGEKVTVSNIEKSIKEEFEGIKEKFSDIKDEARGVYHKNRSRGNNVFEKLLQVFIQVISMIFKIIVVFFGLLFITIGVFLLIGFLISFIDSGHEIYISSFGISTFSVPAIMRLFLDSREQSLAIVGLILVIGIPLIMLIYMGIRLIFKFKSRSRFIGIPAFSLLLAGLVICSIVGLQVFKSFSQKFVNQSITTLKQPKGNILVVDTRNETGYPDVSDMEDHFMIGNWNLVSRGDTTFFFGIPFLEVVKSDNDSFSLAVFTIAKGENYEKARARARNISYMFYETDSSLQLSPYYNMPLNDKIRGQEVKLVLKVPANKTLKMKPSTRIFFEHNDQYTSPDLWGKKWIMTENGLKEINPSRTYGADSTNVKL